ncbi:MAG: pyridoxamine 5'-phosphate oxidase family protein [Promethearchaeota archaeon]|nr:MAG: pyridoxamine 5'-phosphate oxidase family protein [Candidatus Lokiarchaeota archaeon]
MKNNVTFSEAEKEFITNLRVARISTISPEDKYPHIVPICYIFHDGIFYTSLGKNSRRIKNLSKRSEVSLLIDEYKEENRNWIVLKGVLVKVKAIVLNYTDNIEQFMKGWGNLIEKYPQYKAWAHNDLTPTDPDRRRIMQLSPIEKISWGFS